LSKSEEDMTDAYEWSNHPLTNRLRNVIIQRVFKTKNELLEWEPSLNTLYLSRGIIQGLTIALDAIENIDDN